MKFSKQLWKIIFKLEEFFIVKYSFRITNAGQMALSYIGPTIWSKTPDTLKRTKNLNTFRHNLKGHYLKDLRNPNFL